MYNKEYNEEIIQHFNLYHFIYGMEGARLLKKMDEDDFFAFYEVIESIINYNYLHNIFDSDVKKELYSCLGLYRERTKDETFLEKINELITLLNKSNDVNLDEYLKKQFICHANNIFTHKQVEGVLENITDYKQQIYKIMANDVYVVNYLIDEKICKEEFVKIFLGKEYPMFTINYFINCYPEIFKQEEIKKKINGLLLENSLVIKDYKKQVNISNKLGYQVNESEIRLFGKTSKKMMKKIKKI